MTGTIPRCAVFVGLLLGGCSIFEKGYDDAGTSSSSGLGSDGSDDIIIEEGDADADTDADADADADSDADVDTGDTGSTVDPNAVDCTPGVYPASPGVDECVAGDLTCGDHIFATTDGGSSLMDENDYVAWYCTPFPNGDYRGPERTYSLVVPPGKTATVSLDGPCDELDIFMVRWEFWETEGYCPDTDTPIWECEADESRAGGEVYVVADSTRETRYLVVVDAPNTGATNFGLSVACTD